MLRYMFIFGGIIGVVVIALMLVPLMLLGGDIGMSEVAGYAIMLAVLSLVFIGIKRFRDVEHGGVITFMQAAGVGVGIVAVASLFYVLSWEAVLIATDYEFMETYPQSLADAVRAQALPAAEEAAKLAEIEQAAASYRNPGFRLLITFAEFFPVGLVVALVSAAILRNSKVFPARAAR